MDHYDFVSDYESDTTSFESDEEGFEDDEEERERLLWFNTIFPEAKKNHNKNKNFSGRRHGQAGQSLE